MKPCADVMVLRSFILTFIYLLVLSSGMEKTLSQMCGRLYLSIFLFMVRLVNLTYMAFSIILAMLCPSLPIFWKLSTVAMWPVVFWCSNIDKSAFKRFLYISQNVNHWDV